MEDRNKWSENAGKSTTESCENPKVDYSLKNPDSYLLFFIIYAVLFFLSLLPIDFEKICFQSSKNLFVFINFFELNSA